MVWVITYVCYVYIPITAISQNNENNHNSSNDLCVYSILYFEWAYVNGRM